MRTAGVVITLLVVLATLIPAERAEGATQFVLWPAEFSYGTPAAGAFTWNSTVFGLRFDQSLAPFASLRTSLFYGSVANLSFAGSPVSGSSGQVLAGDIAFRVGAGAGPVAFAGFAGYGGYGLNASGPGASDRVVLSTVGFRLGGEVTMALSPVVSLRANYTAVTNQNSDANFSLTSPPVAAQDSGTGSGNEYEIVLHFTPIPTTSAFIGYRSGNYQTTWSGGGTTTSTLNGIFAGVQLSF